MVANQTTPLPVSALKPGMKVVQFLDVPRVFKELKPKTIKFLQGHKVSRISVLRLGMTFEVHNTELMPGDQVTKIGALGKPLIVKDDYHISQLQEMGFGKIEVLMLDGPDDEVEAEPIPEKPPEIVNTNPQQAKIKKNATEQLSKTQESMAPAAEMIEKGFDLLKDVFNKRDVDESDVIGFQEVAKDMVGFISDKSDATNVLSVLKDHDEYTYRHCVDVANQVVAVCDYLNHYTPKQMELIALGGLMHDIGKSKIPAEIINKPGPLDDGEWVIMRSHPVHSAKILDDLKMHPLAVDIAHYHHVKKNGKGYPPSANFFKISGLAKLASIADVYQALVTHRPYKITDPANIALGKIKLWSKNEFDDDLVDKFIASFGVYPVGSMIELSDGRVAFVIGKGAESTRPHVAVIFDAAKNRITHPDFIDLADVDTTELKVNKAVDHREFVGDDAAKIFSELTVH